MVRSWMFGKHLTIVALACGLACASTLVGCGNKPVDTSAAPMPPMPATDPKVPAAGPAISTTLTFDQLALESPVKNVKNKNGLVFLHFRYADRDGSVYKCELPEAMSKGSYVYDEWVRTFNLYRLPEVVAKKKVVKKSGTAVAGDFPFIAPRPQKTQSTEGQPQPAAGPGMPQLPPMPAAPQGGPGAPGGGMAPPPMAPR